MSRPVIRDATPDDLAAVTRIYAYHVLHGLASFELAAPDVAEITRRYHAVRALKLPYLVAEVEGQVAGYAYAGVYRTRPAYRFTVENSVYVDAGYRGHGIGSALMPALIDGCEKAGRRQIIAVIGDSANDASIKLHEKFGFARIGTLPAVGYKFGRWVDSVLMQKEIGGGQRTAPRD
jgi:phosphinothricin acetyltransferase